MKRSLQFTWAEAHPPEALLASRYDHFPAGGSCAWHERDYAQCLWLRGGSLRLRTLRREWLLRAGDLAFLRPALLHRLDGDDAADLLSIDLRGDVFADEDGRHRGDPAWCWSERPGPSLRRADEAVALAVDQSLRELEGRPQRRLDLDWFLGVLLRPQRQPVAAGDDPCPAWLRQAVAAFVGGDHFAAGRAAFLRLAGHDPRHVNRCVRRHYGCTLTGLIRELRLQRAAAALRARDTPIPRLALDCGFENLGYFYQAFKARYACTPAAWRRQGGRRDPP